MPHQISVIIPAYNEEKRIGATLKNIVNFLEKNIPDYELLIVNDGSRDGTSAVVAGFARANSRIKLLENARNRGKGCAVRKGMLAADGEKILFTDADLSTPIEEVLHLLPLLGGADVVIGSRALKESTIEDRQPRRREIFGKLFNSLIWLLLIKGIRDTQCGFKLFSRQAAREIFQRQKEDGFVFDVEALYLAKKLKFRIKEVPVRWANSLPSRLNIFSDPWKMLLGVIRIRLRRG